MMELVCPAGNLPALKAAVDNGCDAVYIGFRDDTNARHFAGLNFDHARAGEAVRYAHTRNVRVFLAINTYPRAGEWERWREAVDAAAGLGVDALILADIGVLEYAAKRWPDLPRHLSVQAAAANEEAIAFHHRHFGIRRVVLPRVLSLEQVRRVVKHSPVPVEVFGFGMLCILQEGRCMLSSYATGCSSNTDGACSPARAVRWVNTPQGLESRLGGLLIDRYGEDERAAYPTVCKGRFCTGGEPWYAIEEPTSLNALALLSRLQAMGVAAVKIEGRQRGRAYVKQVTRVWRTALDACLRDPERFVPRPEWVATLDAFAEGARTTCGGYHRPWR